MTRKLLAVACAAVIAVSCGTGDDADTPHNQSDITFAQQMIPHHEQAIDMASLVPGHTSTAAIVSLAGRIQQAQDPEIEQLRGWLDAWHAPMPSGPNRAMPGVTSENDLTRLGNARDTAFDKLWLQLMIKHHQGALTVTKAELAAGTSPDAKTLAKHIADGQQTEITQMRTLLG